LWGVINEGFDVRIKQPGSNTYVDHAVKFKDNAVTL
jgi:hypothetical protein